MVKRQTMAELKAESVAILVEYARKHPSSYQRPPAAPAPNLEPETIPDFRLGLPPIEPSVDRPRRPPIRPRVRRAPLPRITFPSLFEIFDVSPPKAGHNGPPGDDAVLGLSAPSPDDSPPVGDGGAEAVNIELKGVVDELA
jgi:hypothetical protein